MVQTDDGDGPLAGPVQAYRWLLMLPRPSARQLELRSDLGRALFDALIGPIAKELEDKDELIIIPDGSLGILPFEALILPDGRWLVERFHVTYLPSLAVKDLLDRRGPSDGTRPLLALGGARYERNAPSGQLPRVSPQQLAALRAEAGRELERGRKARDIYAALGLGSWNDIPATLSEVNAIGQLVPGSTVLTGAAVSEGNVKRLSRDGTLRQQRVLHFATHGVVVPGVPELSALVLSEAGSASATEDGYLTMGEVSDLDISADFVDLSACSTGLGTLSEGEGVAGLAQGFLVAGARSLSVSLWQVDDRFDPRVHGRPVQAGAPGGDCRTHAR